MTKYIDCGVYFQVVFYLILILFIPNWSFSDVPFLFHLTWNSYCIYLMLWRLTRKGPFPDTAYGRPVTFLRNSSWAYPWTLSTGYPKVLALCLHEVPYTHWALSCYLRCWNALPLLHCLGEAFPPSSPLPPSSYRSPSLVSVIVPCSFASSHINTFVIIDLFIYILVRQSPFQGVHALRGVSCRSSNQ